jgi:probable phosphoglycerate mutase
MRLLFVRHCQTDGNLIEEVYGQMDLRLNRTGRRQAREIRPLVASLTGGDVEAVYASDLARAVQTAEFACPNSEVITDERLREFDFGEATGQVFSEYKERYPDVGVTPDDPFPYGESSNEMYERVVEAVRDIVATHDPDSTVVAVVHAGVFDCLYHFFEGTPLIGGAPAIGNGDVVVVEYDGEDFEVLAHHVRTGA